MQADGAGGADGARTTMKLFSSACDEIFRTLWDSDRLCKADSATDTVSYATLKKVVNKSLDCAGAPPRYKKVGRLVEGSGYRDAGDVARDQAFLNALEKCVRSSTGSSNMGNKSKPRVKWYTLDGDGPIEWPWESLPKDHLLAQPTPSWSHGCQVLRCPSMANGSQRAAATPSAVATLRDDEPEARRHHFRIFTFTEVGFQAPWNKCVCVRAAMRARPSPCPSHIASESLSRDRKKLWGLTWTLACRSESAVSSHPVGFSGCLGRPRMEWSGVTSEYDTAPSSDDGSI
jgi:hypothetical protein